MTTKFERQFRSITGGRTDGTPPASADVPEIKCGRDLHRVADEAIAALSALPDIYSRGGMLVRVGVREADARERIRHDPDSLVVRALKPSGVRDLLSRCARFTKFDNRNKTWATCAPPKEIADIVLERSVWPGIRPLINLSSAPVLRVDGSVAQVSGYDAPSGSLLTLPPGLGVVPSLPSTTDVATAKAAILDLVSDFPFEAEADKSAWLALALTLLVRPSILGPCPLWIVTANVPGAGKSRLVDVVTLLVTGRACARATHPSDDAEWGKVLTGIAMEGDPIVLFDNLTRPLEGGKVDAWLTGDRWRDRILGTNQQIDIPISTVLAATGNNLIPRGDTIRRVLPIRLSSDEENPEQRTHFKHANLLAYVREHRASLVAHLATLARGWFAAGCPSSKAVKPWGSYEHWTDVVPHVLLWLDMPDPMATRAGLADGDVEAQAFMTLLKNWSRLEIVAGVTGSGISVRQIVDAVYHKGKAKDDMRDLADVLEIVSPQRGMDPVDTMKLGKIFGAKKRRVISGLRLVSLGSTHGCGRWTVEKA